MFTARVLEDGTTVEADTLEGVCRGLESRDDVTMLELRACGGRCQIELGEIRGLVARSVTIHGSVFE